MVTISAECRGIVVLLVVVAGKTGLTCGDLPCVWPMTSRTRGRRVFTIFMQPFGTRVAGFAIDHRLDFRLLKMACLAGHLHHRSRGIDSVTGDAVQWRPVACPVAKAAEDPIVGSFKRPWVPRLWASGGSGSEGKERSALRHRVAHGACNGEHLSGLVHMVVIMAPEASGPIAVAYVVRIGRPVYLHGGKDVSTVNGENSIDCLGNFSFLTLENIRIIPGIISFDEQTHLVLDFIGILVIFHQCIQGKLLDPGQSV
jgi:hypothetical protein